MTRPSVVAVFLVTFTLTLLVSQGVCKHNHNHQHRHNQPPEGHHQQHRLRHTSRRGCTKCPSGSGVVSQCRVNEDTKCRPCLEGASYSAHHSYRLGCLPCSRCGQGLYIAHPCTVRHDTICDACATVRGPRNCDFYARCGIETWNETSRESDVVSGDVNITSCVGHGATTRGEEDAKRGEYSEYGDGHDPRDVTTRESEFEVGLISDVTTIAINTEYKSTSLDGVAPTQVPWTFSDGVLGPTTAADDDSSDDPRHVSMTVHKLPVVTSTSLSSPSGGSKPPFLLANRTKESEDAGEPEDGDQQSSTRKSDDDVDLDFLTSLMARETWDHSQERYEDSPQVALLLSRALKDHSKEERRMTECAQGGNKNGCSTGPIRSAKSEFAHRMEEWHKLDALNTFQVVVIVAVTCAVLLSALWVVLQCRKVQTATLTYDAVDSDEEYV